MGFFKRAMEAAEERMFWASAERVCRTHVHEPFLVAALEAVAAPEACVVCGSSGVPTVDLDTLMDIVVDTLRSNFGRAVDELYHDSESESGYAFATVLDTEDAVLPDLDGDVDYELAALIVSRLAAESWFDRGSIWLEGAELLETSWKSFAAWIKDSSVKFEDIGSEPLPRFYLGEPADGIPVSELLDRLLEVIERSGRLRTLGPTSWYRVTYLDPDEPRTASRLGSPPLKFATQPNRFSPAGVPAFYAARTASTAVKETLPDSSRQAVMSEWRPSRPIEVVDLTDLPPLPSYWDSSRIELRQLLRFLHDFAKDVSVPIQPADKVRDYRPTQSVSHAIRSSGLVDGIVFNSSKTGEPCCVLYVENEDCVDASAPETSDLTMRLLEVSAPPS